MRNAHSLTVQRYPRWLIMILIAGFMFATVALSAGAQDISKKVEIQFVMLGDAPKDLPLISAEINKMTEAELNATVKFSFIPMGGGAEQKYNLLLTSGQPVDLLFTADWIRYNYYARRGAFQALDELVPKYAPELYKFIGKEFWNQVKVKGKIFTIPNTWKEYVSEGIIYREDLRKKFNLPKPDNMANMEAYFDGIKKNAPSMQPVYQVLNFPITDSAAYTQYPWIEAATATVPSYGLRYDYRKPSELINYFESKDFVEDAKLFKRWADKGFWSKSALSVGTPDDALATGKAAARVDGQNAVKYATLAAQIKKAHPEWEIAYIPFVYTNKLVHPVHPVHNGFAIPRSAKNVDRALMFYQKLVMDKRYNFLTEYGIEGKHYKVTPDNHYEMIGTTTTNGFPREAMHGWAWRNPNIQIFDVTYDAAFALFKEYVKLETPNVRDGFAEDATPYQAEAAAFNQVFTQYGLPIYYGMAGDPEAAVKRFLEKAKQAGWEKIIAEFTKQWKEYCEDQGFK